MFNQPFFERRGIFELLGNDRAICALDDAFEFGGEVGHSNSLMRSGFARVGRHDVGHAVDRLPDLRIGKADEVPEIALGLAQQARRVLVVAEAAARLDEERSGYGEFLGHRWIYFLWCGVIELRRDGLARSDAIGEPGVDLAFDPRNFRMRNGHALRKFAGVFPAPKCDHAGVDTFGGKVFVCNEGLLRHRGVLRSWARREN